MNSTNYSLTSVAHRMARFLTGDFKKVRFLQKGRRNGAEAIRSNRINSMAPERCTESKQKSCRNHADPRRISADPRKKRRF
jgi:hypothetical protein